MYILSSLSVAQGGTEAAVWPTTSSKLQNAGERQYRFFAAAADVLGFNTTPDVLGTAEREKSTVYMGLRMPDLGPHGFLRAISACSFVDRLSSQVHNTRVFIGQRFEAAN